jgi:hypothetical protein
MPTSARGGQRGAVDVDRAGVDGLQPVDRAAQRGLAAAGGADHHDHLAAPDREVDVLQHVQRAEVLVHTIEDDQGVAGGGDGGVEGGVRAGLCHPGNL